MLCNDGSVVLDGSNNDLIEVNIMKLTKQDKEIFKYIKKNSISVKWYRENFLRESFKLLVKKVFLNGISRSTFHWSASRCTEDGNNYICFDSSKVF